MKFDVEGGYCTHAHMHTCTHAHVQTCIHAHMHTCTHRTHAYMHTCIHAHMHTCTHAHMHTCTHAHIYMHTCTPSAIVGASYCSHKVVKRLSLTKVAAVPSMLWPSSVRSSIVLRDTATHPSCTCVGACHVYCHRRGPRPNALMPRNAGVR
jgi:hypothetical protein